jgi:hypothetical protein
MALHDAYARRTPYELSLPSLQFGEERFARVAEEAEAQGFPGHLTDIRSFSLLAEVGAILREIRTPDDPPELIQQYGMLMFHAFHFWQNGFPLFLVSLDAARRAVEADGVESLELPSSGSAYLQLPQHLFWVGEEGEDSAAAPESLDGIFVTWTGGNLIAMVVAGVSSQRSGVIAMPLPPVRISDLSDIVGEIAREGTDDFSTSLPGAEIDGLYGVDSAGEALKLVARLLPGLASAEAAVSTDRTDGSPTASSLPYRRMG